MRYGKRQLFRVLGEGARGEGYIHMRSESVVLLVLLAWFVGFTNRRQGMTKSESGRSERSLIYGIGNE